MTDLFKNMALASALLCGFCAHAYSFDQAEKDEIHQIIKDYLMEHPEAITDAINQLPSAQPLPLVDPEQYNQVKQGFLKKMVENEEKHQANMLIQPGREQEISFDQKNTKLPNSTPVDEEYQAYLDQTTPDDPFMGNPNGSIEIIEFVDYNCTYCKKQHAVIEALIHKYPDVKVIYKNIGVLNQGSTMAALAALALIHQDKFAPFHRKMLSLKKPITSRDEIMMYIKSVGADIELFQQHLQSPRIAAHYKNNMVLTEKIGLTGTPSFIIGNRFYSGTIDPKTFASLIDQLKARTHKANDAWTRATPGKSIAIFMDIENPYGDELKLTGVSSPLSPMVELHHTVQEAGVNKMTRQPDISIPAGEKFSLKPGAHHIMMMGLAAPLVEGMTFPVTLHFENQDDLDVQVEVKSLTYSLD